MAKKRANGEGTITKRKNGLWQAAISLGYDDEGKRKRQTVYGRTQAEVRKKLDELKRQLATGTLPNTNLTVGEYLEQWLKEKARTVKPRTTELYRYQIKKYILPNLGRVKLAKLTPLQIQVMMGETADAVGPDTANRSRRVLHTALEQAVRWQLIPRNPAHAVAPLKVEKTPMTIWTAQEAAHFLDTAQGHRLYSIFYLAMSTGLRRGEILGLCWQDIQGSIIHVRRTLTMAGGRPVFSTPKTERGTRRVAISTDVLEVLEQHRSRQRAEREFFGDDWPDTDLVFTSEVGTTLYPRNLERAWKQLQRQAGVTVIRFHDLRHLHASVAVRSGMNAKMLADRLGHAKASFTLDTYTHLFEEQRQDSAVSIQALFDRADHKLN